MRKFFTIFLLLVMLVTPITAFGIMGVGVGLGKIDINEPVQPGTVSKLPILPVLNTGDEASMYGMSVEYREYQPQLRPSVEWFSFDPSEPFYLEPGGVKSVAITLTLPVDGVRPGDYWAFVKAQPVKDPSSGGGVSIGIAAATKLSFTVPPSNIFQGIYYRILSFLTLYAPWTYVVLSVIVAAGVIIAFSKLFSFNIGIGIKRKE